MPYRHAHLWLLALFPVIVLSFWPGYFGHLGSARAAQHAHGITATAWLALLTFQSGSAQAGRMAWHRASGLAVFVVVPLFAAAGMFGVRDMAAEMVAGSPFEAFATPALAFDDVSSIVALVAFVAAALATRRHVRRHAAWMLATALLVLPPVLARLVPRIADVVGIDGPSFWTSFLLGKVATMVLALLLARGRRGDARPFVVLGALLVVQVGAYLLLGPSTRWRAALADFGTASAWPGALAAAVLALVTLILAWRSVPARPRSGRRAGTMASA